MFNSSEEKDSNENKINWNELTDLGQLSEIISDFMKTVAIFKHSTRCSVSRWH
jgi:AICAR transformylase/IMP cyclohydrolase PurH